ncbi:hypothetical protein [Shimia sp. SDUM112013]|uniref:COG3904 family protein n=1 Tax=Shimia sp. SDUM112013 TaxID=3136160 RepID=UPI0032ECED5D
MTGLRTYLNGEQTLRRTLTVFALLPRAGVWVVLALMGFWPHPWLALLLPLLLADLVLFWVQLRGFNRATENHLRSHGSMGVVWGGYLAFLFMAALSATLWWGLILAALTPPESESYADQEERLRRTTYDLRVSDNGRDLVFEGEVTFGLTKRITEILAKNAQLDRLILTSAGGQIYEARGVSKLIRARQMATHVPEACSSACTLIFIAGSERTLAETGRLGFHQYALNFGNALPSVDLAREQAKDRVFFAEQGVSQQFLDRMFDQTSDGLWYPTQDELRDAGIVTRP